MDDSDADLSSAFSHVSKALVELRRAHSAVADDQPAVATLLAEVITEGEALAKLLKATADIEREEPRWRAVATNREAIATTSPDRR